MPARAVALLAFGTVALLAGCAAPGGTSTGAAAGASTSATVASEATAANVRRVGFLTDYAKLRPMPGGGGMLCWRDAGIDWKQFNKVMFERIQVYLKPGAMQMQPVDPTDLKMLIDYFHDDLVKAVGPIVPIVTAAGPGSAAATVAKLQGETLTLSSSASGQYLRYDGTAWAAIASVLKPLHCVAVMRLNWVVVSVVN